MIKLKDKVDITKSLFIICMAVSIVFLLIVNLTYKEQTSTASYENQEFNGWYTYVDNHQVYINEVEDLDSTKEACVIYNVLPRELNNKSLLFKTYQQIVEVEINGQAVYEYGRDSQIFSSKEPGSAYHIINLDKSYAGKIIKIEFKSEYSSVNGKIFNFHIGQPKSLILFIAMENIFSILINSLLVIFGLAFLLISTLFGKKLQTNESLWISVVILTFSMASIPQSGIIQLLSGNNVLDMFVEYVAFFMTPIAATMYARELFQLQENKMIKALIIIQSGYFILCIGLQMFGIKDIKEMLAIYHVLILVVIIFIYSIVYKKYKDYQNRKKYIHTQIICVLLIITIVADIYRFYNYSIGDGTKYTRAGVLVMVIYILYGYLHEYINKSKEYTEARLMAKLAYQDVMTGLYNRTAYVEDTAIYEKQLYLEPNNLNLIYVIFDLNDLKVMNDFHGHSVGDHYIVITGEIIKKAFENIGKCYRIGGDEFAVIIKDKSLGDYQKAIKKLNNLIIEENETTDFEYSLAYGYAQFEAGKYSSLKELIDKADKNMYENKNVYKGNKMSVVDATT